MKTIKFTLLAFAAAVLLCGCKHYDYFLVQPAEQAQVIGKNPVRIQQPPMEYTLVRYRNRIYMDVANPNDTPVTLAQDKSYVVSSDGRTHPVRGGVIAPHSFIPMALPTPPNVYQVYSSYPYPYWGYGPGWWSPWYRPYYGDWYWYGPPPPMAYTVEVPTPYTWSWPKGQVNLHLAFDQGGKTTEQNFIFDKRERKK